MTHKPWTLIFAAMLASGCYVGVEPSASSELDQRTCDEDYIDDDEPAEPTGVAAIHTSTAGSLAAQPEGVAAADTIRRFDQGGIKCNESTGTCGDPTRCLCPALHDRLLEGPKHYVSIGELEGIERVRNAGHRPAFYVNKLNAGWDGSDVSWRNSSPADRAEHIWQSMLDECACTDQAVPRWVVLNELARTPWRDEDAYRPWVAGVVEHLSRVRGRKVLLASPYKFPSGHDHWWTKIQKHAYIGVEGYLSGERVIEQLDNQVAPIRAEYQRMKDAYVARGVRPERLFLVEHFGQTSSGTDFGRAGIPAWKWHKVIAHRAAAAKGMFAGFVSYGWKGNDMRESDDVRASFMETYLQQDLP